MFDDDTRGSDESVGAPPASNCPDSVKRDFYRQALVAKIAEESAKEAHSQKMGAYRALLKKADSAGVSTKAITNALACRFDDPELVLIEERERLKMLDLSGFLPGIRDKLLGRLDVEEVTRGEKYEMDLAAARDQGALAGRRGHRRDLNQHQPGTELHVAWIEGWLQGQRAIADEMVEVDPDADPVQPAPAGQRGRPAGSKNRKTKAAPAAAVVSAETVAEVEAAEENAEDEVIGDRFDAAGRPIPV